MSATVTIRREILDVEIHGTEQDGVGLQRRLSDVCDDVLGQALEAAFAPVDPGDAHLMIERLAIDLGVVSLDGLDAELSDAVHREVADWFRRNPPVPAGAVGRAEAGGVQRRTPAETVDDALVVFLRTGRVPWSFQVPAGTQLEQLVLDAWAGADAERGPPPALRGRLAELLALPSVRTRLVKQFTPGFVTMVLRAIAPALPSIIVEVQTVLSGTSSPSRTAAAFMNEVWDHALLAASAGRRPEPSELAGAAWLGLDPIARADPLLAAAIERRWPEVTERRDARPRVLNEVEGPRSLPTVRPVDLADERDGILVDNSGIVLVHPFLPRFFDGLGVAAGDELVHPGRALCLLHHLATGELTAPEHRLILAKVLCGVRLDEPTEADVGITKVETKEAIALLDAAIAHWGALGESSPNALRVEFLMRPGTLAPDAGGDWLLRVEARTVDVLLDQLPWGISLVKLPWMDRPLRVEWR